jgi:hypothetical protein
MPTRHPSALDFYELCVTEPTRLIPFLLAAHAHNPRTLREDFSGSAALARAWAASHPSRRAIAVDLDPAPLQRANARRVRTIEADCETCTAKADIIAATNFPIGYHHTRRDLLRYLKAARASLNRRGIFVFDLYGGRDAFTPGKIIQLLRAPKQRPWSGQLIEYTFEQRTADARTGRVTDALHFKAWPARTKTPANPRAKQPAPAIDLSDAFIYDWRLWSLPEIDDALHDAGFTTIEFHSRLGDAIDNQGRVLLKPTRDPDDLDENWVVYTVAR